MQNVLVNIRPITHVPPAITFITALYPQNTRVCVCVCGGGVSMFIVMNNNYFHKQQQLIRHRNGNTEQFLLHRNTLLNITRMKVIFVRSGRGFDLWPFNVRFLVERITLRQTLLRVLQFSPSSVIPPVLTFISVLVILVSEGQAGKAQESSKEMVLLSTGIGGALDRKKLSRCVRASKMFSLFVSCTCMFAWIFLYVNVTTQFILCWPVHIGLAKG